MSNNTSNTTAFIEAQKYSKFILDNMYDGLLPTSFVRDVSDFGDGTTLNVKTVGDVTLQEVAEEQPMVYSPIDTGTVTLTISDYKGAAWSISDVLRQDGTQIDELHAMQAKNATRALQEHYETRFLSVCNSAQTDANANNVNGFAHRIASGETNDVISLAHIQKMKLAFDKANVPSAGRILLVDPVVEATLNGLMVSANAISYNPMFEGIVNTGFSRDHQFVRNIFGFDIYTCNRLPTGNFGDGSQSVTGAVANIAMCVLDDQCKPIMSAWRQMPTVETDRNVQLKRDQFDVVCRFGLGAQRTDSLGVIVTSASNY
jgi:hypothetical protein